jgi:CBS-domain-containing membrane protein
VLVEHGISAVPVVDEDNRIIGMSARVISCIALNPEPNADRGSSTR